MPRGRSSSSRSSSYGSRGSSSQRSSPAPQQQQRTPMPTQTAQNMPMQPQQGGMMSGLGSTLMTGMAFGAGSEIAHQAVRGIIGGGSHGSKNDVQESGNNVPQQQVQPQQQTYQSNCMSYNQKFVDCLKVNGNDISDCQNFFNDLKSCEKGLI